MKTYCVALKGNEELVVEVGADVPPDNLPIGAVDVVFKLTDGTVVGRFQSQCVAGWWEKVEVGN